MKSWFRALRTLFSQWRKSQQKPFKRAASPKPNTPSLPSGSLTHGHGPRGKEKSDASTVRDGVYQRWETERTGGGDCGSGRNADAAAAWPPAGQMRGGAPQSAEDSSRWWCSYRRTNKRRNGWPIPTLGQLVAGGFGIFSCAVYKHLHLSSN